MVTVVMSFNPVPAITPANAPKADLNDAPASFFPKTSSPMRAPRKQPAIMPM